MVMELQGECQPAANKILEHLARVDIPALNYDEMKQCVCDQVNIMAPDEAAELPAKKRKAFFACQKPSLIEEEISTYSMLAMQDEDPLIFWSNNEKYFPRLALLSRLMLAVAASSASSERAFKELRCVLGNFARNRLDPKKTAALIHLRTNWFKDNAEVSDACSEVESSLHVMEKWVNKLRQDERPMKEASSALKSPAETRWLSYFMMVEALLGNFDCLRNAVLRISPANKTAFALLDLTSKNFFQ
uniref:HAT C-terminal dimerisation domain-containing protein n=1 Tax=Ditylenchus dipsaci TaxID=166011 RepID=A0A915DUM2_9BILA